MAKISIRRRLTTAPVRRCGNDTAAAPDHKHAFRLSFVSSGTPLTCRVDVERSYGPKARYALRMLLVPLGLEPRWVESREPSDLYYGRRPMRTGGLQLAHAPAAAAFLESGRAFDTANASWFTVGDTEVPRFFADEEGRPDLVASAFLWLSGWQERAVPSRDEHGRAAFADSLNAALGTTRLPVVDAYREHLARQLRGAGVEPRRRTWAGRSWAFCPTHDVDYVRKRRAGILYRELVENLVLNHRGEPLPLRLRRALAVGRQMAGQDPYVRSLYEMPLDVAGRGGTATYFVKAGAGDPHDVSYRVAAPFLRRWMDRIAEGGFEIGLHPSYRTIEEPERLQREKERLERVVGRGVTSVRHHYLRYDPSATGRLHARAGFRLDSTLGHAEHEGFRRGTCMPFQLYDLERDRALDVWEMPLAVMDSTLFNRRGYSVERAVEATAELADACRRYGGVLVGLWHTTLGDEIDCPGWRNHFVRTLDEARGAGAFIASLAGAVRSWA